MKNGFVIFLTLLVSIVLTASSFAQTYPFPDTGQTKCYNNTSEITCPQPGQPFYGQDAQYQPRLPRSYTKLGHGGRVLPDNARHIDQGGPWIMTKDNVTGLIWELKTRANAEIYYPWSAVSQFIAGLNNSQFGGFRDWRLPDIKEQSSRLFFNRGLFVEHLWFPMDGASGYWAGMSRNRTCAVDFGIGSAGCGGSGSGPGIRIRAVRGGPPPQQRLIDNGNGTVTDISTRLMWKKCPYGQNYNNGSCTGNALELNWQQALQAAEALIYSGFRDWRLPNRNELQSLVDYSRENIPLINPLFPDNSDTPQYWTSTSVYSYPESAFWVSFTSGSVASLG